MKDFVDRKFFQRRSGDFVHQKLPILGDHREILIVGDIADTSEVGVNILPHPFALVEIDRGHSQGTIPVLFGAVFFTGHRNVSETAQRILEVVNQLFVEGQLGGNVDQAHSLNISDQNFYLLV